jgi:hypothetical protein
MSWDELLDITPGMFLALNRQFEKIEESRAMGYRFLATVISHTVCGVMGGKGQSFMPEAEDPAANPSHELDEFSGAISIDDTRDWFKGLAEQAKARENIGKQT